MSLATRCTACGTVFRVVKDQLRVSDGWVRCGRCAEVFNAIESLVDLELDRPAEEARPGTNGARVMEDLAQVTRPGTLAPPAVAPSPVAADAADVEDPSAGIVEDPDSPLEPGNTNEQTEQPDSTNSPEPPAADATPGVPAESIPVKSPSQPTRTKRRSGSSRSRSGRTGTDVGDAQAAAGVDLRGRPLRTATPAFVREADRAARWRKPAVRWALGLAATMAGALLSIQATLAWHDEVAARWPFARGFVEQLCQWQGCRIDPPRRIESLTVDSSGLLRVGSSNQYRLAVVIRNHDGAMFLRVPALDLTLTDAAGQTVARRVIDAPSMGAASGRIEAGAELAMARTLAIDGGPVTGYTIELFYP